MHNFPELSYCMDKTNNNEVIIYTAIFDNIDYLKEPDFIPDNCRFVCFTNMPIKSRHFEIRMVTESISWDPVRNAKIYKVLSHKYFPDSEYTVWIDGTRFLTCDIHLLIDKYLCNTDMALFAHRWRDCIYEEAKICIDDERDDPEIIKAQMERYRKEGYPEKNGLITGGIILRRNTSLSRRINMQWWDEICNYSRRDQLSFNYVAYKNNLSYGVIGGDYYHNPYFGYVPHLHQLKKLYADYISIQESLKYYKSQTIKYRRALESTFFGKVALISKSIYSKIKSIRERY
jgi:hypothetical protein